MKSKQSLKSILGVSQEELSALLGVSRGQLSMYESGKRDLPLPAMLKLANMLAHMENRKTNSVVLDRIAKKERVAAHKQLEKEMNTIAYQKEQLGLKINVMEKLRQQSLAAIELAEFLKADSKNEDNSTLVSQIENRAVKLLEKNSDFRLMQLQLKHQGLEQQLQWISQKIKSYENEALDGLV